MRFALTAVVVGMVMAGSAVAHAETYLVLSSGDPALKKGAALEAGAVHPLKSGSVVTLMSESGEVVRLTASDAGLRLPAPAGGMSNSLFTSLQNMLLRKPPSRRAFGAMRGATSECPRMEDLTSVESIVEADKTPACRSVAAAALEVFIAEETAASDEPVVSAGPQ
jgi:hypothetical protein